MHNRFLISIGAISIICKKLHGGKSVYCRYCGKETPDKANFCPSCGNKLPLISSMIKKQAEEREHKETPVKPVAQPTTPTPTQSTAKPYSEPVAQPVSHDKPKNDQMTPLHRALFQAQRERELRDLLERNLITKEEFERRKLEITKI